MFSLGRHKTVVPFPVGTPPDPDRWQCALCGMWNKRVYVPTCQRMDHGVCKQCFRINRTRCVDGACRGVFKRLAAVEFLRTLQ
jgi:hypothetical protein